MWLVKKIRSTQIYWFIKAEHEMANTMLGKSHINTYTEDIENNKEMNALKRAISGSKRNEKTE